MMKMRLGRGHPFTAFRTGLAAVEEIMQARCLRSQVYYWSRMREYVTSDECGKSLAHNSQNVILLAKRTTDELLASKRQALQNRRWKMTTEIQRTQRSPVGRKGGER